MRLFSDLEVHADSPAIEGVNLLCKVALRGEGGSHSDTDIDIDSGCPSHISLKELAFSGRFDVANCVSVRPVSISIPIYQLGGRLTLVILQFQRIANLFVGTWTSLGLGVATSAKHDKDGG